MTILINLALMLGLILALMMVPLLYWRGFRARPGTTLLVTLLSLFLLAGAAMRFDRLFPGCRAPYPGWLKVHRIHVCGLRQ